MMYEAHTRDDVTDTEATEATRPCYLLAIAQAVLGGVFLPACLTV